ncbi:uncharacterized protein LOC105220534 isoform X1 [Zeugodacus cucurbitae]|uniref:uncharacterized protein LOC105220534 isoform X1 n=2 Tax=Zeugodacus cucurbitae TaxID=28588 RepID=UPI0023D93CA8|nr:uncharacterized protein LOC105220534 isoform X1 [Zeugodacus cucurbitae]XP_028901698.2 uncharacterized protein LOC105220534 isoform X1 [Zeugodacus cucurbitae]XP_054084544.1 uncharacterized protein LOC105220534 isoform X1 [Zeugodacus cucurbitae]XP_054084545.1 uncharacterized protein LOC105220534 isoform X1 [Zeugodacus cucurbitae]
MCVHIHRVMIIKNIFRQLVGDSFLLCPHLRVKYPENCIFKMPGKRVTLEMAQQLYYNYKLGKNIKELSEMFSVSQKTVYNVINRAENEGRLEAKRGTGPKPKISDTTQRLMARKLDQNPTISIRALMRELNEERNMHLSHETVRQAMRRHEYASKSANEQMPAEKLSNTDAEKTLSSEQTKEVIHNQNKPTRYERERAELKNKPRRVLNLEERVLAIRLYHQKPVYQRVASVFKCSWEQIRNVIANRDDILQHYGESQTVTSQDTPEIARNKKINFLGNVTYEFIRRAQYHRSVTLNDVALRQRALKLRDILQIEQFHPNKEWLADFKKAYNVEWDNLDALIICGVPPRSLDNKDLIEYCTRMVAKAKSLIDKLPKSQARKEGSKRYDEDDSEDEWAASSGGDGGGDGSEVSFDDKGSDTMSVQLDDDVPVVNEIDDFTGMYLDPADNDEEDFNGFATAGPTDIYGTEETEKYDFTHTTVSNDAASPTLITTEPILVSEVQIKEERRSRSRSRSPPLLSPLNVTSGISTNATTVGGGGGVKRKHSETTTPKPVDDVESNNKRFKSDTVVTYTEALHNLCTLEEYATQEEDFEAINLLMQLARVLEKRCTTRRRMFSA